MKTLKTLKVVVLILLVTFLLVQPVSARDHGGGGDIPSMGVILGYSETLLRILLIEQSGPTSSSRGIPFPISLIGPPGEASDKWGYS